VPPPLDYQTPPDVAPRTSPALLLLPTIAGLMTLIAAGHSLHSEPFGVFEWPSAIIQVGCLVAAVALWVAWAVLARRACVRWTITLPALIWAVVHLLAAWALGAGYFREPWNS